MAIVVAHPKLNWQFQYLLRYRRWSIRHIEILLHNRRVDWKVYSQNPYINADTVRSFLSYPWDWTTLAKHPGFPPQEIYEDRILFPRWKWKSTYMNPRISSRMWKRLHTRDLMENHFHHSRDLQERAYLWIIEFINTYVRRRRIVEKLDLLIYIKRQLPVEIVLDIYNFV
jgi:hypothetical protein